MARLSSQPEPDLAFRSIQERPGLAEALVHWNGEPTPATTWLQTYAAAAEAEARAWTRVLVSGDRIEAAYTLVPTQLTDGHRVVQILVLAQLAVVADSQRRDELVDLVIIDALRQLVQLAELREYRFLVAGKLAPADRQRLLELGLRATEALAGAPAMGLAQARAVLGLPLTLAKPLPVPTDSTSPPSGGAPPRTGPPPPVRTRAAVPAAIFRRDPSGRLFASLQEHDRLVREHWPQPVPADRLAAWERAHHAIETGLTNEASSAAGS
jgi:hypothetical protein